MKKGWELKKLGDVCISASSNVSQNKLKNDEGNYPIFGASGLIKNVSFYHRDKPYLSIVKDGSGVGRITKMDAFTSVIGTLQYIMPKEGIDLDYLNYSLMSVDFKKYVAGAAIPHIYFKDYKNETFLWMPLPEQQRIVSILDKCFEAIDKAKSNAEKNLKNAKELFESYLNEVFEKGGEGWEIKKLGEVCKVIAGQSPEGKYYNQDGIGMPFYQGKKEFGKKFIGEPTTWTSVVTKVAEEGDILMSVRAPVGPVNFATEELCIGRGLAAIRPSEKMEREFVYNFLLLNENKLQGNEGAVFNSINKSQIESIEIPSPPLTEQKRIVLKTEELRKQTEHLLMKYQRKIAVMEELKKSILQKAFSGEL